MIIHPNPFKLNQIATFTLCILFGFCWVKDIKSEEKEPFSYLGSVSCASASCHNQNLGKGKTFSEYTTYTGFDPHHKAYDALFNPRSDRMMKNLYATGAGSAATHQLCLNCHSPSQGESSHKSTGFSVFEGVGCESCHGAGSGYISVHFTPKFLELSSVEKEKQYGLTNTKDLATNNRMCADCHIGNTKKGMEVNHDLIAAGHPRLNFEFSSYLAQYPKHWKIEKDLKRQPDLNAKAWAIGQIDGSRAALQLLQDRAELAGKKNHPWPEFTEYDCFSCHKDLRINSRKYQSGYGAKPGALPWGSWFNGDTLKIALLDKNEKAFPSEVSLQMNQFGQSPAKIVESCKIAIQQLEQAAKEIDNSPFWGKPQLESLAQKLIESGKINEAKYSWDEFAQIYLGLAAIQNCWSDLDPSGVPPEFTKDMMKLKDLLINVFPNQFDSPKLFEDRFSTKKSVVKSNETFSSVFSSLRIK